MCAGSVPAFSSTWPRSTSPPMSWASTSPCPSWWRLLPCSGWLTPRYASLECSVFVLLPGDDHPLMVITPIAGELATARAVSAAGTIMVSVVSFKWQLQCNWLSSSVVIDDCLNGFRLCRRGLRAAWRKSRPLDQASDSSSCTCTRTATLWLSWCAARSELASRPSRSPSTRRVWDVGSLTLRTGTCPSCFFPTETCLLWLLKCEFWITGSLLAFGIQVCPPEAPDFGELRGFGPRQDGQGTIPQISEFHCIPERRHSPCLGAWTLNMLAYFWSHPVAIAIADPGLRVGFLRCRPDRQVSELEGKIKILESFILSLTPALRINCLSNELGAEYNPNAVYVFVVNFEIERVNLVCVGREMVADHHQAPHPREGCDHRRRQ